MKVLQIITDTNRRGAQVFATDLEIALDARGHEVKTYALANGSDSSKCFVEALGPTRRSFQTLRRLRSIAKNMMS